MGRLLAYLLAVGLACPGAAFSQNLSVQLRSAAPPSGWPLGPAQPGWMAAHFINVGQGSAALFEFSCGLVLVDTGRQDNAATDFAKAFTDYLDEVFARRTDLNRTIDVVYLTHPHPDHTLGAPLLIEPSRYRIRYVVADAEKSGKGQPGQKALIRWANLNRVPQVQIRTSMITSKRGLTSRNIDPLRCSGSQPDIRVLWGSYDEPHHWSADDEKDENNHSVAIRIAFGDSSFLITGDMEIPAIKAMLARYAANIGVLNTDVYVAGHHGSSNGTTAELVRAMSPEMAVFSAGDPSAQEPGWTAFRYGHPNRIAYKLLVDPAHGVSMMRPSKEVAIGNHGTPSTSPVPPFNTVTVDRAAFSTGWDGNIVILANLDGTKQVIIER
jgi:competence protein ComEC